jgi:hypothetical protein
MQIVVNKKNLIKVGSIIGVLCSLAESIMIWQIHPSLAIVWISYSLTVVPTVIFVYLALEDYNK